jgi:dipeptidyl aminopeptidase/acylaminoacyl peptidase
MDAQRAIRTVRFNAERWNINSDRIGIMGFSAGGHLASTAGTHYDNGREDSEDPIERVSSRPDFLALIYPVISFDDKYGHSGSKKALLGDQPDPELVKYFSNELHVKEDTPPTILIHSQDDKGVSVKNSLVFYDSLLAKGVSSEMHLYPYGGHGYSLAVDEGYLSTWIDRVTDWIKRKGVD